jgi:CheY-like chemotaxis protein
MKNASIMIVEDELIVAEGLRWALTGMGYTVPATASSGTEALQLTEEHRPDLVLMDIILEGSDIDGVETAGRIRSQYQIPVIFLTAYSDDATLERVKETEPQGYILKPFNERELHSSIELALHKHRIDQEIQKRDTILFAVGFAIEYYLRYQREHLKAKSNGSVAESGILEILGHMGLAIDADSVAIFRLCQEAEGNTGAKIQYIWVSPDMEGSGIASLGEPAHKRFTTAFWKSLLSGGRAISGCISTFPEQERGFFEEAGISSVAILPLFKRDSLWGFITFADSETRDWSRGELEALLIAGNIIGAILD